MTTRFRFDRIAALYNDDIFVGVWDALEKYGPLDETSLYVRTEEILSKSNRMIPGKTPFNETITSMMSQNLLRYDGLRYHIKHTSSEIIVSGVFDGLERLGASMRKSLTKIADYLSSGNLRRKDYR